MRDKQKERARERVMLDQLLKVIDHDRNFFNRLTEAYGRNEEKNSRRLGNLLIFLFKKKKIINKLEIFSYH